MAAGVNRCQKALLMLNEAIARFGHAPMTEERVEQLIFGSSIYQKNVSILFVLPHFSGGIDAVQRDASYYLELGDLLAATWKTMVLEQLPQTVSVLDRMYGKGSQISEGIKEAEFIPENIINSASATCFSVLRNALRAYMVMPGVKTMSEATAESGERSDSTVGIVRSVAPYSPVSVASNPPSPGFASLSFDREAVESGYPLPPLGDGFVVTGLGSAREACVKPPATTRPNPYKGAHLLRLPPVGDGHVTSQVQGF